MTTAHIIGGDLIATDEPRVLAGRALPFGVVGSTNLGRFEVEGPGIVTIPRDLSHLIVNEDHSQMDPRGRFLAATEGAEGLDVRLRIAETDEGDELLARAEAARQAGKPLALSVEVKNMVIRAGKAVSGTLTGVAFVERGAFPGAALLAAAVDTEPETTHSESATVDEDGTTVTRTEDVETETDEDGSITTTTTTVVVEETPATEPDEQEEADVANATVPSSLAARAASASEQTKAGDLAASDVFDMITKARRGDPEAGALLAALSDIKISGSGALPASGVLQPAWLGELWRGKAFSRRYMPLIRNGSIQSIDEKGFTLTAPSVAAWSGNKAELPTGTGTTTLVSATFQRWGYAGDIAREFYDIPGNEGIIEAFIRNIVESYARVTDDWTLAQIVAAATAGGLVAPDTYPTDYPESLGMLIQGIQVVEDAGGAPTFAIANDLAWKELLYTPRDQVPEFISFSFGLTEGQAAGSVVVVKGDIGIDNTAAVLVGGREAAHVNELAGASPLQLDALDIAHGGLDKAVIGYTQYMTEFTDGLQLVGVADV